MGITWLGGKNLDEAIVDQIIIPNLQQNFAIDGVLSDVTQKGNFKKCSKILCRRG
jgi:molecular chaperone DnaK